ncbi:MAG: Uma2 family endonuclease [Microcystis aeruginosa SX13-01]|nr:Uma2 family endonuclease [Microcystis aeruginosa SX13-01]
MSLSLITRKFTVEEYEKMTTQGIIKPDEKVELIRGEIIKMSPMGTRHAASQPEPDLSLLIPRSDFYVAAHPCPQDIYLIIEVSDSTIDYDRNTKIPLYAEANIQEVWIVNLKEECLEVYRHPLHGSYQNIQKYSINERVFITSFPDIEFTIAEILGV